MRIPFPERVPLWHVLAFATILCGAQILQGTDAIFTLYSFLIIVLAGLSFNIAGGFTRPSGAYIFFYSVFAIILGLATKAYVGERGDSNLRAPNTTLGMYTVGMFGILIAAFLSRRFSSKRGWLSQDITEGNMQRATIGCLIFGVGVQILFALFPTLTGNGSLLSAIAQINRFLPMAIILGVIHAIRKSGGTKSYNVPVLIAFGILFFNGLISFSKEGMFTPVVCYVVAAASQRYRLSLAKLIAGVVGFVLMLYYLVPYSQYARQFRTSDATLSESVTLSYRFLTNLGEVRAGYFEESKLLYENDATNHYFNNTLGIFDRLQMISVDDALVDYTEQGHVYGTLPLKIYLGNIVPHFILPNKPYAAFGNIYAHELGMLPDDDSTTGVSFSPAGDAFHEARWVGAGIIFPVLVVLLFLLYDSMCGDVRLHPWGLLAIGMFSHAAPETLLSGLVNLLSFGAIAITFVAYFSTYFLPILGAMFSGPENTRVKRIRAIRSIPARDPRRRAAVALATPGIGPEIAPSEPSSS